MGVTGQPRLLRRAVESRPRPGGTLLLLLLLLLPTSGASGPLPSLLQPQPSVLSGQGNPHIWCVVRGSPVRAHVLSWYQQRQGRGPTFLLSQRHGAPPTYGLGVNPRFLAEMDLARNGARLTVGNAGPADEGTYYCAMWVSGLYVFGDGTRLFYQAEAQSAALRPPVLSLLSLASGPPSLALCVALGQHPDPLRLSWVLRGQPQEEDDFTGSPAGPQVSWLQLPPEAAGRTVGCWGLHQAGAVEAALPVPRGPGCRRLDRDWNGTSESRGDMPLAELERTLAVTAHCYLGLLSASVLCSLALATVRRRSRCRRARPQGLGQEAPGAPADSRPQTGGRRRPARAR